LYPTENTYSKKVRLPDDLPINRLVVSQFGVRTLRT